MTVEISVRLDDDLLALDGQVRAGRAISRAAVIRSALRRLMREQVHRHDAEVYSRLGTDPDLEHMVRHAARQLSDPDVV